MDDDQWAEAHRLTSELAYDVGKMLEAIKARDLTLLSEYTVLTDRDLATFRENLNLHLETGE